MDKETLLKELRSLTGWEDMLKHGKAGVRIEYKGITFLLYRDDATHCLKNIPKDNTQEEIIKEFNTLMKECSEEIKKEMERWNQIRLVRDDNEGDLIGNH